MLLAAPDAETPTCVDLSPRGSREARLGLRRNRGVEGCRGGGVPRRSYHPYELQARALAPQHTNFPNRNTSPKPRRWRPLGRQVPSRGCVHACGLALGVVSVWSVPRKRARWVSPAPCQRRRPASCARACDARNQETPHTARSRRIGDRPKESVAAAPEALYSCGFVWAACRSPLPGRFRRGFRTPWLLVRTSLDPSPLDRWGRDSLLVRS
jgi:hypothetical protein